MERPRPTSGLKRPLPLAAAALALSAATASASETIDYSYDARGRLVMVVRTATANGSTTGYGFDKADNRLQRSTLTLPDPSFELPDVGSGHAYNPTVTGIAFTSFAGVAANGSAFAFATAPDGDQVGFLQAGPTAAGAIAISVTGLTTGASYRVRFRLARRPGYGLNTINLAVGGSAHGTFSPSSSAFESFESNPFTATGSPMTITFTGTIDSGDRATALDAVSIVPS
ncbi:MAG: hypothetical protein QOI38_611 [Sphingomonadales bacterium]|jgi:hypothetical protein|nr:hypothetical protein [Sphingomonadales bacterium]